MAERVCEIEAVRKWDAFQEDREFVLEKLREGHLDHVEVISRVVETQFFHTFLANGGLETLAQNYPTPRKKEEVPLWLYLSSQITLRLHGSPGYASLPYVVHCGGLRDALEDGQLERKRDSESGENHLSFKGYNGKNSYQRRTPCDQDFVRKLARDTNPDKLEEWFGRDAAGYFGEIGAYDPEGIFFVDGSYLFVPDSANYEHSKVAYFDEHNHPISKDDEAKLTKEEKRRCRFRRYYQLVGLSHCDRDKDFLIYAGSRMIREAGEVQAFAPLVENFVDAVGPGVMKVVVVDRGFIDGRSITRIKSACGVDVVVPLKSKMNLTDDAWRLAEADGKPWRIWEPPARAKPDEPSERPERIRRAEKKRQETVRKKKEAAGVAPPPRLERVEFKVIPSMEGLWDTCDVPINVVLMREHMSDGTCSEWGLMTTREVDDPLEIRELYELRPSCEEGWRQTKCYWDMTSFRSPAFSLVVNQVVFVLLAYSLLQIFLRQSERGELAKATRQRLLAQLLPDGEKVAVYYQNHVGYFSVLEYSEMLLTLTEGARRRVLGTTRRLRKTQLEPPELPRRPPR